MIHYVYTTARGLCRTVHAETLSDAWQKARKRHTPTGMHDLTGRSWVAKAGGRYCVPASQNMIWADACCLYFKACLAEIPIARDTLPRGEVWPGDILAVRGLAESDGNGYRLTDLGRAFAEWIAGGAK